MKEPDRKSFLDVLKSYYNYADRLALTTRFVYIATYTESETVLEEVIKQHVAEINEEYGRVVLTGLLLAYNKCFLHLIEASEEIIFRHLQFLIDKKCKHIVEHVIPLAPRHNVYKLYFTHWYFVYIKNPPVLLDEIENTDVDEIHKQVKNCLTKIYSLSEYIVTVGMRSKDKTKQALKSLVKVVPHLLPEITIVMYLLSVKSHVIPDARHHLKTYTKIMDLHFYNDSVWPAPVSMAPRVLMD